MRGEPWRREERRRAWPIRPYEGIYDINTEEEYNEALFHMGCLEDTKLEYKGYGHGWKPEGIPWVIHYAWGKDPDKVTGYSRAMTETFIEERFSSFRRYNHHISVGYSPVHTYKCISLDWARENHIKQVEALEKTLARHARLLAEIPKTIQVRQSIWMTGFVSEIYEKPDGTLEIRYVKGEYRSSETEVVEHKLFVAYKTNWFGCNPVEGCNPQKIVFVTIDSDGQKVWHVRHDGKDHFRREDVWLLKSKEDVVRRSVPGEAFEMNDYGTIRNFRRLKAKEIRKYLDKGILNVTP